MNGQLKTPTAANTDAGVARIRTRKSRSHLRTLLLRKEAPFLLAALAAVLCWVVSHISSRLLEARLISFSEEKDSPDAKGTQRITYTIKNLTRTVVFTNLGFILNTENENGSILGNSRHSYPENRFKDLGPTFIPDRLTRKIGFDCDFVDEGDTTLRCTISQFHPQREATLTVYVKPGTDAPLRFRIEAPSSQQQANELPKREEEVLPVLFEKSSLWTLAVEYEFHLTIAFALGIVVCMIFYAIFLSRNPEEEKAAK
jgi:hypothetical protein